MPDDAIKFYSDSNKKGAFESLYFEEEQLSNNCESKAKIYNMAYWPLIICLFVQSWILTAASKLLQS